MFASVKDKNTAKTSRPIFNVLGKLVPELRKMAGSTLQTRHVDSLQIETVSGGAEVEAEAFDIANAMAATIRAEIAAIPPLPDEVAVERLTAAVVDAESRIDAANSAISSSGWEALRSIERGDDAGAERAEADAARHKATKLATETRKEKILSLLPNAVRAADYARRAAADAIRARHAADASAAVEQARAKLNRALEEALPGFMAALSRLAGCDENWRDRRSMI